MLRFYFFPFLEHFSKKTLVKNVIIYVINFYYWLVTVKPNKNKINVCKHNVNILNGVSYIKVKVEFLTKTGLCVLIYV